MPTVRILQGDCRETLRSLPDRSVHMVVCSPPYWGLRDYGLDQWEGGDSACDHKKSAGGRGSNIPQTKNPNVEYPIAAHRGGDGSRCGMCGAIRVSPTVWGGAPECPHESISRGTCGLCGAWRGSLGQEETPGAYVAHLVEVFREAWRIIRGDGTLWLNLGDTFCSTAPGTMGDPLHQRGYFEGVSDRRAAAATRFRPETPPEMKPKDLVGIPWMVAFALREAGWYLRRDIIFSKENPMPESAKDRPTTSHEYIFLLTKEPQYFYDGDAIKEEGKSGPSDIRKMIEKRERIGGKHKVLDDPLSKASQTTNIGRKRSVGRAGWRNARSVWTINTVPYREAHFAVFPVELPTRCILAGTSAFGCCRFCGAPWERLVRWGELPANPAAMSDDELVVWVQAHPDTTFGWTPTCVCRGQRGRVVPAVVLDCFSGAGTTGLAAARLGRDAVLCEANPDYVVMSDARITGEAPLLNRVTVEDAAPRMA